MGLRPAGLPSHLSVHINVKKPNDLKKHLAFVFMWITDNSPPRNEKLKLRQARSLKVPTRRIKRKLNNRTGVLHPTVEEKWA